MGIAQGDMQRVRRKIGEVVGGKLFEGAHEGVSVRGRLDGEAVRFALVRARNTVLQQIQHYLGRPKRIGLTIVYIDAFLSHVICRFTFIEQRFPKSPFEEKYLWF